MALRNLLKSLLEKKKVDTPSEGPNQDGKSNNSKSNNLFFTNNDDVDSIVTLGTYHPYHKGSNPNFNQFSAYVLDVKSYKTAGQDYFAKLMKSKLSNQKFVICTVPSSSDSKLDPGIRVLAQKVAKSTGKVDGTACLVRHTTIQSAHSGGARSVSVHLNSIKVVNEELIKDANVLLIDDVTTTGCSLEACKSLLLQTGAKKVQCFALAKTYSDR